MSWSEMELRGGEGGWGGREGKNERLTVCLVTETVLRCVKLSSEHQLLPVRVRQREMYLTVTRDDEASRAYVDMSLSF